MSTTTEVPAVNGSAPAAARGKAASKAADPTAPTQITVQRIGRKTMIVPIVGTAPLMVSRFSEKAKRQMLDAQQGRKSPRQNREPETEYRAGLYLLPPAADGTERYGFPAVGFKASMIGACRYYGKALAMTSVRQWVFVEGEHSPADGQQLVLIHGEPQMRESVVRLAGPGRTADLRYRPEFPVWRAELTIVYVESCISQESVLSLLDAAGMGVGVGEWRPERNGDLGTFQIDPDRDVVELGG